MQLQEIKNEYITSDGTKIEIIPIGKGSKELEKKLEERLGESQAYCMVCNEWYDDFEASMSDGFYGLSRKDFVLFNTYDALEEDMEMVGYGLGRKVDKRYDYFWFNAITEKFDIIDYTALHKLAIYARRKKEVKESELIVEEGKRYVRRDGKIPDPVEWNPDLYQCSLGYIFRAKCPVHGGYVTYTKNGKFFHGNAISQSDLIEEYVPLADLITININGFDVPLPARVCLPIGTNYCTPNFRGGGSKTHHYVWDGDYIDDENLKNGIIHISEDAAIQHREAILSFTKLTK